MRCGEHNEEAEAFKYRLRMKDYPRMPHMRSEEARLQTFARWPVSSHMRPCDLAQAGLYYIGQTDHVQCFCCGGMMGCWEPGDTAWGEHEKHCPNCLFVLGHDVGNIPLQAGSSENGEERLKEKQDENELEKLHREKQCKICMDRDICMAFVPCGHLVACQYCSDRLTKCPICCCMITLKIKTYIS